MLALFKSRAKDERTSPFPMSAKKKAGLLCPALSIDSLLLHQLSGEFTLIGSDLHQVNPLVQAAEVNRLVV